MPTPQETIQDQLKTAMKAGDKTRVGTLRMLLTTVKNERIDRGEEVDEKHFLQLVRKAVKQRREAAEAFRKGDRLELAEKEDQEAEILESYLPSQASEDDVRAAVEEFVDQQQLAGPSALGQVMPAMMKRFGATSDGGTISRIAREILNKPSS